MYTEFEAGETIEALVVTLADIIQCSQYADNEVKLGNSGYMSKIAITSRQRATIVRRKITEAIGLRKRRDAEDVTKLKGVLK